MKAHKSFHRDHSHERTLRRLLGQTVTTDNTNLVLPKSVSLLLLTIYKKKKIKHTAPKFVVARPACIFGRGPAHGGTRPLSPLPRRAGALSRDAARLLTRWGESRALNTCGRSALAMVAFFGAMGQACGFQTAAPPPAHPCMATTARLPTGARLRLPAASKSAVHC